MGFDYLDVYEFHFYISELSGYNNVELTNKWHKFLHTLFHLTLWSILLYHNVLCIYLIYESLHDPKELMYISVLFLTTSIGTIKIIVMNIHKNKLTRLHIKLKHDLEIPVFRHYRWRKQTKEEFKKKFKIITKSFYLITIGAIIIFLFFPVFFPGERTLPYIFPLKNLLSPYYEAVYVMQSIIIILFMFNIISYDMVCYGLVLRLCSYLEIIAESLRKYDAGYRSVNYYQYVQGYSDFEDENAINKEWKLKHVRGCAEETIKFLKENIQHHEEIIRDISTVNDAFNIIIFLQTIFGTVVCGICASTMFRDTFDLLKDIRLSGFAIGGFADLFIYCYCGSHIVESGERVKLAVYSLPWYEMDVTPRKIIAFMLQRLHKINGLTSGKFFKVNLELFLQFSVVTMKSGESNGFIADIYDLNEWLYNLSGFGAVDFPQMIQRFLYLCYRGFVQLMFLIHIYFIYEKLVMVFNDRVTLSFVMSFAVVATVGLLKISNIDRRRKEFEELKTRLKHNLNLPWLGKHKWEYDIKDKNSEVVVHLTWLTYFMAICGLAATTALPLLEGSYEKFFVPFPHVLYRTPYYVPIYVAQLILISIFFINFVSHDMVFLGLIQQLCDNLEIIETSLKKLSLSMEERKSFAGVHSINKHYDSKTDNTVIKIKIKQGELEDQYIEKNHKRLIRNCIVHHQAILRELELINSIFGFPIILHFIFGPLLIGIMTYVVSSGLAPRDMIIQQSFYAVPAAIFLMFYCYFGSRLSDKANDVHLAFYSCPWYEMDIDSRKLIIMALLGFEKIGKLKAANVIEVDLTTYLTMAKISYNILTLLRSTSA